MESLLCQCFFHEDACTYPDTAFNTHLFHKGFHDCKAHTGTFHLRLGGIERLSRPFDVFNPLAGVGNLYVDFPADIAAK